MTSVELQLWPHQIFARDEVIRLIHAGEKAILVTTPTGGGKSLVLCELIRWAVSAGWLVVLYTNRRLLIDQLSRELTDNQITFGVRASGHQDRRERQVQISSLPTERVRTLKNEVWKIHGEGFGRPVLALVDEAHINAADTACRILRRHVEQGGVFVGVTATPIGLAHLYTKLVIAGKPSELRACGALVPAYHYGPDEPDMKNFRQSVKTGEYTENDVRKAIMTPQIFGRVWAHFEQLNAERRPTILFAPGVQESIWFAEQFEVQGVRAAHIDGKGLWVSGSYENTTSDTDRRGILNSIREGHITVLCNRFVCREGVNLPEVGHLILATVFGSLQSYLQAGGRALRAAPWVEKTKCVIQDHGGHFWRHGSINMDRNWFLEATENILSGQREEAFRNEKKQGKNSEPIRCPKCNLIRASGPVCPQCGHQSTTRSRVVLQTDGSLQEQTGDIYKPQAVKMKDNTLDLWKSAYWRAKNSKNRMTFRQAMGLFFYENHYYPPKDLPLMPTNNLDWYRSVADVPVENLST